MNRNLWLAATASSDSGSDIFLAVCLPDGSISFITIFFSLSQRSFGRHLFHSVLPGLIRGESKSVVEKAGEFNTYYWRKMSLQMWKLNFFSPLILMFNHRPCNSHFRCLALAVWLPVPFSELESSTQCLQAHINNTVFLD